MKRALLVLSSITLLANAANATTYTNDSNLSDFLTGNGSYATLSNFSAGDTSSPYTPTDSSLSSGLRVYDGGNITGLPTTNNWILASFSSAVSAIRVFPNMDHLG